MTELVFRTTNLKEFEILEADTTLNGLKKYRRKSIPIKTLIQLLTNLTLINTVKETEIFNINTVDLIDNSIISHRKTNLKDVIVLDFKEQIIRTFYNEKYYKIVHCNAFIRIFINDNKISVMEIYPYEKYEGKETKLYDNPFPNGYNSFKSCLGSADREIKGSFMQTVISLLETSYTHSKTNFSGTSLKDTTNAFEYLRDNPFPYDKLVKSKKTLKDIL